MYLLYDISLINIWFFFKILIILTNLFKLAYLEIPQRVELLNERCNVISDLLDMLREDIGNSNMTRITWIIIWLIVVAVFVAIVCIVY